VQLLVRPIQGREKQRMKKTITVLAVVMLTSTIMFLAGCGGTDSSGTKSSAVLDEKLVTAASRGSIQEIQSYLDGGADIDAVQTNTGLTLLLVSLGTVGIWIYNYNDLSKQQNLSFSSGAWMALFAIILAVLGSLILIPTSKNKPVVIDTEGIVHLLP
jgi:hypothetical protein